MYYTFFLKSGTFENHEFPFIVSKIVSHLYGLFHYNTLAEERTMMKKRSSRWTHQFWTSLGLSFILMTSPMITMLLLIMMILIRSSIISNNFAHSSQFKNGTFLLWVTLLMYYSLFTNRTIIHWINPQPSFTPLNNTGGACQLIQQQHINLRPTHFVSIHAGHPVSWCCSTILSRSEYYYWGQDTVDSTTAVVVVVQLEYKYYWILWNHGSTLGHLKG